VRFDLTDHGRKHHFRQQTRHIINIAKRNSITNEVPSAIICKVPRQRRPPHSQRRQQQQQQQRQQQHSPPRPPGAPSIAVPVPGSLGR
jgi:hypothetical protein